MRLHAAPPESCTSCTLHLLHAFAAEEAEGDIFAAHIIRLHICLQVHALVSGTLCVHVILLCHLLLPSSHSPIPSVTPILVINAPCHLPGRRTCPPFLSDAPPSLLLGCPASFLNRDGPAAELLAALRTGLPGADVDTMVEDDPRLLFEPGLVHAIPRLHSLWPGLDPAALAASSPTHLALALRALSDTGPPRRY